MSDLQTRQETSKGKKAEHPKSKNEGDKSPTVMDNASQSTAIGIDLDIDSTIDSLTHVLKYFLNLKEKSQSKVQKASPVKEDISGADVRCGGSTKSPKRVTFADKSSGNFPSCDNFRHSEPRSNTTLQCYNDSNITMTQMDSTHFPSTGATGYDPSSSGDSAKRGGSPSNHGKKFPRSHRKRKNNRNNTYAKETESSSNPKGTSQNSWLSNESQKYPSNTYKNAHSNGIPRYEMTAHRDRGNGRQSGNQLPIALLGLNIHGDSVQNSQNSSVSGKSISPNRTEITSIFYDQKSDSATNEPVRDSADTALDLCVSRISSSRGTENPRQWGLPSSEIGLLDSTNVLNPGSQQFQPFYSVDRMQSNRATPRYSSQFVAMENWFDFLQSNSIPPYFNSYYTSPTSSMHSNIILSSNLIQQYSSYGNAYETLSSTNLYLNSMWSAQESSNSFNNDHVPFRTSSNNSGWFTYP